MAAPFKVTGKPGWFGKVTVAPRVHRRVRLCSDLAVSRSWLVLLQNAADRKGYGEAPDPEKLRGIPRRCLESLGLVSKTAESRRKGWADLVGEYADELTGNRRSAKYVKNVRAGLLAIGSACGWRRMADVGPADWAAYVGDRQKPRAKSGDTDETTPGASARTLNNELATLRGFVAWGLGRKTIDTDPLAGLGKVEEAGDRRRVRRALTDTEIVELLRVAGDFEVCYRLAVGTGLRLRETRELQWRDVILDGRPHLQLRPEATKARRGDILPLSADLVERLRAARPQFALPTARVFKRRPTLDIWETHLRRAGIDYRDAEGRIVGFHSLRVTFITNLQKAGLAPRTVMQLARHTDWRLTGGTYTDMGLLDIFGAVQSLPTYPTTEPAESLMEGTNNAPAGGHHIGNHGAFKAGPIGSSLDYCEASGDVIAEVQETPMNIEFSACSEGKTVGSANLSKTSPSRTRTYNNPVNSRVLYH